MKLEKNKSKQPDSDGMSLMEHLGELRKRLVISAIAVAVGAVIAYSAYGPILNFFLHPLCSVNGTNGCRLYVTGPADGFALRVKVSGYAGLFIASPVVLSQLWKFIAPGLHKNEKRYAIPFVLVSFLLFAFGALVAYEVFPFVLKFLQGAAGAHIRDIYSPQSYLNFILILMVAFGIAFEFPVVLVSLELMGVVSPQKLAKNRRWAIVLIFAAGAVLIPSSDPYSLFALAIPLVVFYEASILLGRIATRKKKAAVSG